VDLDDVAAAILIDESSGPRPRRRTVRERLLHHGTPLKALLAMPDTEPTRAGWEDGAVRADVRKRARRFAELGARLVTATDPEYPARLASFEWAPPWLYVRGSGDFARPAVAIVGTRRATPSAREFAAQLARGAARAGVCVVSGLARGIDAAAHRGALEDGGMTIAVLGTGVDRCYPAVHRALHADILGAGLVVSEYPPGAPPRREHFPARNRVLAGLARAVVVVQAPAKSGALVTGAFAADQGAEVLAVPGDPLLPENAGSNQLLAAGARLALGVEDVLSAVHGYEVPADQGEVPDARDTGTIDAAVGPVERTLLAELDLAPRAVDLVARAIGAAVSDVLAGLIRLELAGLAEQLPGGAVRLTPRGARFGGRWAGAARLDSPPQVEPRNPA
jgi:DNA processing protein